MAETVVITESHCRELVRHVPADDVAYRPGVEVKGRSVAPADLGGGTHIPVPDPFAITIKVELSERHASTTASSSDAGSSTAVNAW